MTIEKILEIDRLPQFDIGRLIERKPRAGATPQELAEYAQETTEYLRRLNVCLVEWWEEMARILNQTITEVNNGGASVETQDEGVTVNATTSVINFVGDGVTATDGGSGETIVTIPGGDINWAVMLGDLYGPGLDGAQTLDGITPPSFITVHTLNGVDYWELNRNISCTDLTIDAGVYFYTRSYVVWVNGTLTVNGVMGAPGGSGGGGTGFESGRAGGVTGAYVGAGTQGANGNNGGAGSNGGASPSNGMGGAGGNGGTGFSGGLAGGTGGAVNYPAEAASGGRHAALSWHTLVSHLHGPVGNSYAGGAGGASGGGGNTGAGGQGGGGGGACYIAARNITGSGTITCAGGAGQSRDVPPGLDLGGGGGGGGGFLGIVTETENYQSIVTVTVAGGAAGIGGTAGGTDGTAGATGLLIDLITPPA